MILRKRIDSVKAKEAKPKPRATAAEKRGDAQTLAEAKRRERGDLLLKLAGQFGAERVESVITSLDIDWYTVGQKWEVIVPMICRYGAEKVNGESGRRWGGKPRYLEREQLAELEKVFPCSVE